jgi:uncharacterized protein
MSHEDLHTQIAYLESVLAKSKAMAEILKKTPDLRLPNWYVGAGAIAQTVWNELHGYLLDHGLKDCDLVYFDEDSSSEAQNIYRQRGSELFASLPIEVEITNEARVHLWYKEKFGKEITPYLSYEKKVQRWKSEWPMLEVITWDGMPH